MNIKQCIYLFATIAFSLLAQKIKEIARDNNIHIVENKPLARMLFHNVDLGAEIPPELYRSVAEILAMIYKENN